MGSLLPKFDQKRVSRKSARGFYPRPPQLHADALTTALSPAGSNGSEGNSQKKTQKMQIKALLLLSLLSLVACQVPTPEPEPESTTSQVDASSGLVSYVLTYADDITELALQRKCDNLNCTQVIFGVIKAIVVTEDPTGVQVLSEDPLLTATNQNSQVSLDFSLATVSCGQCGSA